jgi:hypothetical protein
MGSMTAGRASKPLGALVMLLASPAVAAPEGGDAIIARARAAESAQLRVLSRAPVAVHTNGRVSDGKTTHTIETFRRVQYGSDGTVSNTFERGQIDGKPAREEEVRKAMGAKDQPKEHGDVLTWALAPLSSPDMEVTAVGPAQTGGYTLRCRVKRDAMVSVVTLLVDEKTGRKRTANIEIAGARAKLADRLENVLTYADDGGPARLEATFHFKLGWIERSAQFRSERIPPPHP